MTERQRVAKIRRAARAFRAASASRDALDRDRYDSAYTSGARNWGDDRAEVARLAEEAQEARDTVFAIAITAQEAREALDNA